MINPGRIVTQIDSVRPPSAAGKRVIGHRTFRSGIPPVSPDCLGTGLLGPVFDRRFRSLFRGFPTSLSWRGRADIWGARLAWRSPSAPGTTSMLRARLPDDSDLV